MTSEALNQTNRSFLDLQHRYRGLIAALRSRAFVKNLRVPPSRRFRIGLKEWLLDARATIDATHYRALLDWMAELAATQLHELDNAPIGYEELSGIYVRAPIVALEQELRWITERVRLEETRISVFLAVVADIQRAVFLGEYENAIEAIGIIEALCGISLWSVQLRLSVEHLAGGLERQKRYSAEVRGVYQQGLLAFTTYHSSVRNEDRTTLAKFMEDITARIERHRKFDEGVKVYARYRLKGDLLSTDANLADVLRIEQSHGIVDVYETYIAVLQEIARRGPEPARAKLIIECISSLKIKDFRLTKLMKLLAPERAEAISSREHSISDELFSGKIYTAIRTARKLHDHFSADPWHFIYAGFALSYVTRPRDIVAAKPTDVVDLIALLQSRCEGSGDAWPHAAKLALNLRGLPLGAGLFEFLNQLRRSGPDSAWQPWLIGLNSPDVGPEDRPWNLGCSAYPVAVNSTSQVWYEASCPGSRASHPFRLARAAGEIHRGDFMLASETLGENDTGWPESLRTLRALLSLHALFACGERQKTIALIAREGALSAAHAAFLPVAKTLRSFGWADYKKVTSPLAAPIALHLLWTEAETSLVASQMRFATGAALRAAGVVRPSDLADCGLTLPHHELVYFLRYLCVPEILDLTRLFSGTRAIMEERQAICSRLIEMDPARSTTYEDEIIHIANELALDEGRWIVDSTRIHVDSDALIRWAMRSLFEDYERYRDLLGVALSGSQSFEDVLRELDLLPAQRTSFVPENEADAVLVSILRRLGEEFLTNATFGLDFYLSKRVRHQSFIGLIRGPLEFAGLITTRESEGGEYNRNSSWIDRFQRVEAPSLDGIDAALRRFAARFDEILGTAKDAYFHLRSAEKPQGMILLLLDERLIRLARGVIQLDLNFREFLAVATPILWAAIEPSLSSIRTYIAEEIKAEVIKEFDVARAAVRKLAEQDPAFLDFDAAMGKGSAEVQIKLDEAAHWFVHADTLKHQRLFTLEQMLKIGIDTALKTQRGYAPKITQSTEGDVQLYAPDLVFIHDVLFVGLGNAQKHSAFSSPKIDITARWNEPDSTITLTVVSDCRPAERAAKQKQVDLIRKAIDSGTHLPRTRKEGDSGFAKLAPVVGQSERGRLTFGFTPEGRFRLEVTYAVLFSQNREIADAA